MIFFCQLDKGVCKDFFFMFQKLFATLQKSGPNPLVDPDLKSGKDWPRSIWPINPPELLKYAFFILSYRDDIFNTFYLNLQDPTALDCEPRPHKKKFPIGTHSS